MLAVLHPQRVITQPQQTPLYDSYITEPSSYDMYLHSYYALQNAARTKQSSAYFMAPVEVRIVPLQSHRVSGEGLSVIVQSELFEQLKHRHRPQVSPCQKHFSHKRGTRMNTGLHSTYSFT